MYNCSTRFRPTEVLVSDYIIGGMLKMDFSQRMGLAPVKIAQVDSIDNDLRTALWNVLTVHFFEECTVTHRITCDVLGDTEFAEFAKVLYSDFYKEAVDTLPRLWSQIKAGIRVDYFNASWHRVYCFLEFVAALNYRGTGQGIIEAANVVLERENSAYRFVGNRLAPIISNEEICEVESAISNSDQYAGVRTHLQTSLGFLVDRQNPDYRNSIKESISAVESLAKKLVGDEKATLGQALKVLEKRHHLHPSLKTAFSALYGYTNDADGIRHSLMDNESQLTKADARFMLICCSAFINFAIDSIED